MKTAWSAAKEIFGLFVEDGSLAVAILAWVVVAALMLPHLSMSLEWHGPVLFLGVAALLLENVWRSALKHRRAVLQSRADVDS